MNGLHLKYRPKGWYDFIGCTAMVDGLKNKVDNPERPHTYLFTGSAGTGKTSGARLFIEEVANKDGLTFDVFEENIASNNGVDYARDLESRASRRMIGGITKFFIMDECHRLSKDAQNVLLKVMEDTPKDTYFIFLTTEPEKLIDTFISRCTVYRTSKPTKKELVTMLEEVVGSEGLSFDRRVLAKIAEVSEYSPRLALTKLESIIGVTDPEEQLTAVTQNEVSDVADLCKAMLWGKSWSKVTEVIRTMKGDPESIRRGVLGYLTAILMKKDDQKVAVGIDIFKNNWYDSGKAGLVLACYELFNT